MWVATQGTVLPWKWTWFAIIVLAVLLRLMTGLSSYSGAGDAPKYGDYEAQRHWMELAVNLPARLWYTPSEHNEASYWPLDYPPLSGYQREVPTGTLAAVLMSNPVHDSAQSWVHGQLLQRLEPAAVALGKSRGYETPSSKLIMRLTVVASDLLVYFPASLAAVMVFCRGLSPLHQTFTLAALLLQPALLLTDHAHFQYNCISLGLAAGAAAAIGSQRRLLGSFLFCLSLNHKQMALFYAPAFFAHLLGLSLQERGTYQKVLAVVRLGLMVLATFAVCWAPYLGSAKDVMQLLARVFPVKRGLFEDYVANFWCATSLVIKWRSWFSDAAMLRAAAGTTLLVAAPSMVHQVMRPSPQGLLLGMANSAFSFYMFSYQVHEKSILLPLLPVTLLAAREPALAFWLPLVASFSMFPLLVRDGAALPYLALCMVWAASMWGAYTQLASSTPSGGQAAHDAGTTMALTRDVGVGSSIATHRSSTAAGAGGTEHVTTPQSLGLLGVAQRIRGGAERHHCALLVAGTVAALLLHAGAVCVVPPVRLPWLYDRLFITLSFVVHLAFALYLQLRQWEVGPAGGGSLVKASKLA